MQQDYKSLLETVKYHAALYYDNNKPVLSDREYDGLYDKLSLMEERQGWADSSSPTMRVGGAKGKVKHPYPLYSLKKVYDSAEIDSAFIVSTIKIDGSNLSITYNKDGSLRHVLTRGDGEFGENVTHLVSAIAGIPTTIEATGSVITVTGEAVTDRENVTNFRNFVSGSLGVNKVKDIEDRQLKFIAHDVLGIAKKYTTRMGYAESLGFLSPFNTDCTVYPSDGVVYRVDDYAKETNLGYTSKYPRFAVALKERGSLTAVTTLQNIVWSIGRSGVVTPVAVVEPVVIDDATISRVILHNIEYIENHDLGPGDQIMIERQITPQFVKVLSKSSFARFSVKDAEQQLSMTLTRQGPKLYASASDSKKLVEYFVKQLGVKGLGPRSIDKLDITHPSDLFDELVDWDLLGKNGSKVLYELGRPKPYETVLASLGIPGVGKATAKTISQKITSFDRLREIEYESIKGIGPKTVDSILAWLDVNEDWVSKLPYELEKQPERFEEDLIKIAISGKLDMTKNDLRDHLKEYGVVVKEGVTKDLDFLISSGEKTSKTEKAVQYGVPVIDYWKNKSSILKGKFNG
jgi:DNA ligase (NAD+)